MENLHLFKTEGELVSEALIIPYKTVDDELVEMTQQELDTLATTLEEDGWEPMDEEPT